MLEAVEIFLKEKIAQHSSASLLYGLRSAIAQFIEYLRAGRQISNWQEVTTADLRSFADWAFNEYHSKQGEAIKRNTVRLWMSRLRVFFGWLRERNYILDNPAARLAKMAREEISASVLSEAEMSRIIEMADTKKLIGLRDRAMMETLYATGIRVGELRRLDIYDVDTAARRLTVNQGKGNKDRILPLTEQACYWLNQYIVKARPKLAAVKYRGEGVPPSSALWLSRFGKRPTITAISIRIRGYARQAKVKASAHAFRRSFATHLLRGGARIEEIQKLLGHGKLQETQIYTQVGLEDLKRMIEQAESKDNK
jgi:integrase/recombinase XerD